MTKTSSARSAIITGAANGIGRASALRLAANGYRLLLVDRDEVGLEALASVLKAEGADVSSYVADVSKSIEVKNYVQRAHELFGGIDAFFNNAGIIGLLAPLVEYPDESFDEVISINLRGVFLGLKHVLPGMYERGSGAVVNTSSVAGLVGHLEHAGYVASKRAVVGLTKVAGAESASHGVRVNAIAPGPTQTDMIATVEKYKSRNDADSERRRLMESIPAHRYGEPSEVAAAVAFLLGDESHYVNGSTLTIDGAFTSIR